MKKITITVLALVMLLFSSESFAQFAFGVSPGLTLNSTYFGYRFGKLVPYVGFQYFNLGYSTTTTGTRFNYTTNQMESYTDESTTSGSLIIPNIGMKYFFIEKNSIQAYGNICFSKPIVFGTSVTNGEVDDDFKDEIKKVSLWGGELGFGVEYFFSQNFSVGGEFGFRFIFVNYKESEDEEVYNSSTGMYETHKRDYKANFNFSPTYSKISLNYYFGDSE